MHKIHIYNAQLYMCILCIIYVYNDGSIKYSLHIVHTHTIVRTILNTTMSIIKRTTPATADTIIIQTAMSFLIVLGESG